MYKLKVTFVSAVVENLDAIMIEFPDFNFDEFYQLAKRINDFLNDPDFQKWSKIITESIACNKQVD